MDGLSNPWDLGFTSDGTMFFTEKCRGLSVRRADGKVARLFGTSGSSVVASDFFCRGQSGMLGVAVDPDFASNRYVFVYMSSNRSSPGTNRVVRLAVNSDFTSVSNRTDIVGDIAYKNAGNAHGSDGLHSGGRIRFGSDGFLYITTGDNHNGALPQDLTRLGGKVLRVDRNGAAAPGNNTPHGDSRIYTFGHRNVQGIGVRAGSNQVYIAEHGPGHSDEVTLLSAGGNGGWDPRNRAGLTCSDGYCGYDGSATSMPMTDTARFPDAMRPLWNNGGASQGTGPASFLSGSQWKAWDGRLAVGIMGAQQLKILQLSSAGTALLDTTTVNIEPARYRSLVQGSDGNLYVATDSGEIWQMEPR